MKIWLPLLLLCLITGLGLGLASAAVHEPPAPRLRCLFLIETSSATALQKSAITNAVAARILSGLDGQMHAEELFSIWTYDQSVSTQRYLPAAWNRQTRELLAMHLTRALEDQPFSGQAQLDSAMPELFRVIAASDTLTILIINNGARVALATRFDEKINSTYQQEGAKAPGTLFLTTLFARGGHLIGWAVEPLPGSQSSPAVPRGPDPALPLTVQAQATPAVLSTSASAPKPNRLQGELSVTNLLPRLESARDAQNHPKIEAKTVVAHDTAPPRSIIPTTAQEPRSTGTQGVQTLSGPVGAYGPATRLASDKSTNSGEQPAEKGRPVLVQTAKGAPPPVLRAEPSSVQNRSASREVQRSEAMGDRSLERLPEPKAREVVLAPQFALTPYPERPSSPRTFLMMGVGLIVLAVLLLFFVRSWRREAGPSSLISKSLDVRK